MDTKVFPYFITLYQTRNMHKAAEQLYITQQGLSRILQNLEKEFGVHFFERNKYGMFPTKAGDKFYEYAVGMQRNLNRMQLDIHELATGREELRIACAYGTMHILYQYIQMFYRKYPDIWIKWIEYTDLQTDRILQKEEVDLAFCVSGEGQEKFELFPLFQRQIMLLVYPGHPFWNRQSIEVKDLKGEKIVMEGSQFHIFSSFREKCLEAGFYPDIVAQTTEMNLCHKLCRMKEGLGIAIDFIAKLNDAEDIRAIPIETEGFEWQVCLAAKRGRKKRPGAEKFLQFILEQFEACLL